MRTPDIWLIDPQTEDADIIGVTFLSKKGKPLKSVIFGDKQITKAQLLHKFSLLLKVNQQRGAYILDKLADAVYLDADEALSEVNRPIYARHTIQGLERLERNRRARERYAMRKAVK
ncbi:hypothetical protein MSG34_19470 [Vibrio sp. 1CM2L]|uniref:hypothetical protein n=1 Tax=Vibrio sp. 1CM2L TaxID=2929166 RepID=UPI0020C0B095|nr:hypothetical protein [Vibrio sp. 1CM2L]MCK8078343.1 hypothetical protein [Vibrio sp. 1CM2L]